MYDDLSLTFAKENQIHLRHTRGEGAKWNHMSDDNPSRYLMSSREKSDLTSKETTPQLLI